MTKRTFNTGPVDPTKPMELDDGTAVELSHVREDGSLSIIVPKDPSRDGISTHPASWIYDSATGIFLYGDPADEYVLRNVEVTAWNEPSNTSLPEDDAERNELPMFDGLLAYFPNALAEVARISKIGNDQHNPGQPLHWARGKSTDHGNKMMRHLADIGKMDARGARHSARLAWRSLANLQEELERDLGLPVSRGSRAA